MPLPCPPRSRACGECGKTYIVSTLAAIYTASHATQSWSPAQNEMYTFPFLHGVSSAVRSLRCMIACLGGPTFSGVAGGGLYVLPPCHFPSECRPEVAHSLTQHAALELG